VATGAARFKIMGRPTPPFWPACGSAPSTEADRRRC